MDDGLYPRFSAEELAQRRQSIVGVMEAAGVSHLVAYGAEKVGSAIPWLTEWPVTTEAALLVTPGETPLLLVQHYNHLPNARVIASDCEVEWGGAIHKHPTRRAAQSPLQTGPASGVGGAASIW